MRHFASNQHLIHFLSLIAVFLTSDLPHFARQTASFSRFAIIIHSHARREEDVIQFLADVNSRSRSLYAIADPSVCRLSYVCRLSVTLVHPTQPVEIFGNFFHHTIAQGLWFSDAKIRRWGTPLSP